MKIQLRSIILGVALFALLGFAGLNWSSFSEPTELSLLVDTVEAPIGLVMLGFVALLTVFFGVVMARYHVQFLLETSKAAKELQKLRGLAERAEESRLEGLREYLTLELGEIRRLQQEQLEQSEAAAVNLAETLFGEATNFRTRLESIERERKPDSQQGGAVDSLRGGGESRPALPVTVVPRPRHFVPKRSPSTCAR